MRCIGRTKNKFAKCKNSTKFIFCESHTGQWFGLVGFIVVIGGLIQNVAKPIYSEIIGENLTVTEFSYTPTLEEVKRDSMIYGKIISNSLLKKYELIENSKYEIVLANKKNKKKSFSPTVSEPIELRPLHKNFEVNRYYEGNLSFIISNIDSESIFLVDNVFIHWKYFECDTIRIQKFVPLEDTLREYSYKISFGRYDGQALLTGETFKYGFGEADKFNVFINFPAFGVYHYWVTFGSRQLGKKKINVYKSEVFINKVCEEVY